MKSYLLLLAIASIVRAAYVVESLSFGYGPRISPNQFAIPNWQISGEGHTPRLLSDKVILTPPYPGNLRGALWSDKTTTHVEWTADFGFRATGPDHAGGNIQIWYTKGGQNEIGTASVYTVGKFDGMVIVIDQLGGQGGSIRGFLNDGTTDYKSHHHVEGLAFGHCDYSYRNLGRPSQIQIRHDASGLEVRVDDEHCIMTDKVRLPSGNYFGITAASSENPDSFEVFDFVLKTTEAYSREEPRRDQVPVNQGQESQKAYEPFDSRIESAKSESMASPAQSYDKDFAELKQRVDALARSVENLNTELPKYISSVLRKEDGSQQGGLLDGQLSSLEEKLRQTIDKGLIEIHRELRNKDYLPQFAELRQSLAARHDNLLENLPDTLGHIISSRSPKIGFFVFLIIGFQLTLVVAYVIYKRRRAGAPKKYL